MSGDGFTFLGYPAGTFADASHNHAGADITSGTVAYGRLPVGTASSTVAAGDHGHSRYERIPADHNLLAWSVDPLVVGSASTPVVAGRMEFVRFRLPVAGPVTNIVMNIPATGGTSLTSGQCFAALYTAASALVAQTADQAVAWATSGTKTMALAGGPYTLPVAEYIVTWWYNGTTSPGWARAAGLATSMANIGLTAPNLRTGFADTGRTTTAPTTLGAQTAGATGWFAALS